MAVLFARCGGDGSTSPASVIMSVAFHESSIALGLGASLKPTIDVRGADGALLSDLSGVEWQSSNTSFVTVDAQGTLRGIALGGPATVTASIGGKSATTTVSVVPASVAISPAVTSMGPGESIQLQVAAYDAAGTLLSLGQPTWVVHSFSATTIAAITPQGLLTALTPGPFEVVATIAGASATVQLGVRSELDGRWSGTGSVGRLISLEVQFAVVTSFSISNIVYQGCVTLQLAGAVNAPISVNQFAFSFSSPGGNQSMVVSGTFWGDGTMTGAHTSTSLGLQACTPENGGSVGVRNLTAETFTATKQ
jgi:hypothetical protein